MKENATSEFSELKKFIEKTYAFAGSSFCLTNGPLVRAGICSSKVERWGLGRD
jgi:hypothetical protein